MTRRRWFGYALAAFGAWGVVVLGSRGGWALWAAAIANVVAWLSAQALCHATEDLAKSVNELLDFDHEARP